MHPRWCTALVFGHLEPQPRAITFVSTPKSMHSPIIKYASSVLFATLLAAGAARAADEKLDPETKARVDRFEKGPAKIDVSSYPAPIQAGYEVFREKCALCHKLSRPINSDYALPDEWSRYVKRMMYKPGSNISAGAGKKIYTFLVYDSAVRKKAMVDEKLAKLAADARAAEEAKIKEVLGATAKK
jgi:cytochrome c5